MNISLSCKNILNKRIRVWYMSNSIMDTAKKRQISHIDKYKKKLKVVPVSSHAQVFVINTGSYGMGRSILLKTNCDRYLFNCGEGIQKMIPDVVSKLGPVDNIFFTCNTWNNTGGLMGFLMANCSEIKHVNTIRLHGPPNVDKLLEMTKSFTEDVSTTSKVEFQGIDSGTYEDSQLTIEYVKLQSVDSKSQNEQSVVSKTSLLEFFDDNENENSESNEGNKKKEVVCYIIRLKELPPKVDAEKLLALKTPSGPWIKKLIDGEEVTFPDGKIVKPDDVLMQKGKNIAPILVLDCPTEDYLDSLIMNKQLLEVQEQSEQPVMMIHMAPAAVIADPRYKAFMDRYKTETVHVMMNENSHCPYLHRSQMFQSVLNRLHPGIFPALLGQDHYNTKPTPNTGSVVQACHGLCYNLRPESQKGFTWDDLVYYDKEASYKEMKEKAGDHSDMIDDEIRKLRCELKQQEDASQGTGEDYPEIVFLGTGSAKPSMIRNASCILLQMRKDEYFIMDCGEATLLQMYQMYGLEKTNHILCNLKALFVSHLHYDHHGGVFGILEARQKAISKHGRSDRLTIFAPKQLNKWFHLYSRYVNMIDNSMELVPHQIIYEHMKNGRESGYISHAKMLLNLSKFEVMPVVHTSNSYGISIKHKDGWKLVYSGDSKPSVALINYGKDCDILIHEGTFDDPDRKDASIKKHSTTSQAIEVGRKMNAKYILLTHFSQRYKVPEFTDKFTEDVGFSFDFMQVRWSQLRLLHLLKPALSKMFIKKKKRNIASYLTSDLESDQLDDLNSEDIGDKVNLNEGVSENGNKRKNDSKNKANKSMKMDSDMQVPSISGLN